MFKGNEAVLRWFTFFIRFNPVFLLYSSAFNRRMVYKAIKLSAAFYLIGLVRRPYVRAQILSIQEAEQQMQEEQVNSLLAKIDIKLSEYPQTYFVIISAYYNPENDEELADKQRTLFEINAMINKKLDINQQYFSDIKFLFIGDEDIYNIIQVANTQVEFYPKQREKKEASVIYIMSRDLDGQEKLLTATAFRADLKSTLNYISKHKARKFAESMQF